MDTTMSIQPPGIRLKVWPTTIPVPVCSTAEASRSAALPTAALFSGSTG